MSEMKIPGLIAKENEITQEQADRFQQLMKSYVSDYEDQVQKYQQQVGGYVHNEISSGLAKKTFIPQRGVLGGPVSPKTRIPQPDTYQDYESLLRQVTDKRSQFELLLDQLFSFQEKREFLESIGYTMDTFGKFYKEDSKAPTGEMNGLFLYEITIKFKNLLLTKGTLKLKL